MPNPKQSRGITFFDVALATMCLVYIWRIQQIFPPLAHAQVPTLSLLATIIALVARGGLQQLKEIARTKPFRLLMMLLALMVISVPTSVYQGHSLSFIYQDFIKTLLFMALVAAGTRSQKDVRRLFLVQIAGMLLFEYMSITRGTSVDGKLSGVNYYDANDFGMLLVCTIPLAVALLRPGEKLVVRLLGVVAVGFFSYGVILSGSRGAFLGLVAVGTYLLFRFTAVPVRLRFGAVAVALLLLLTVAGASYWESMKTILNPKADYNWSGNSVGGRMEIWKRGVGYMIRRPISGVGVAAFGIAEGTFSTVGKERAAAGVGMKWSAAHNSFIQVAGELGVTGIVLFLMILYHTAKLLTQAQRAAAARGDPDGAVLAQALRTSLFGYAVCGFFLSAAYLAYLYVLIGLSLGLHRVMSAEAAQARLVAPVRKLNRHGMRGALAGYPVASPLQTPSRLSS